MPEEIKPTPPAPATPKTYEFLNEFDKRNSLIEAMKFALSGNCTCEACQRLKIFADVLEEDRKKGGPMQLMPK